MTETSVKTAFINWSTPKAKSDRSEIPEPRRQAGYWRYPMSLATIERVCINPYTRVQMLKSMRIIWRMVLRRIISFLNPCMIQQGAKACILVNLMRIKVFEQRWSLLHRELQMVIRIQKHHMFTPNKSFWILSKDMRKLQNQFLKRGNNWDV